MSCSPLAWAMETDQARSAVQRLILMGIGDVADDFGFAMKDVGRLRALCLVDYREFEDELVDLIARRVIALVPECADAYAKETGWRMPSSQIAVVLTGWPDRERLEAGGEHPLLGEVCLP